MARYDGVGDWYDDYVTGDAAAFTAATGAALTRLLGPGPGRCLDVGCGTGALIPRVVALGWEVTGVDVSRDQLRVARRRLGTTCRLRPGDATALPFPTGDFDATYATLVHTDLPNVGAFVAEMARVLIPGGRFVYVGTHPCFVAPFIRSRPDGTRVVHPGYVDVRYHDDGPGMGDGIRARVGAHHHPLSVLIGALPAAGLRLDVIEELHGDPPHLLAVAATKGRGDSA